MDEGIVEGSADETLERADGVFKVRRFLGLCWLANGTLLETKTDKRSEKRVSGGRTRRRGTHTVSLGSILHW